MKGANKFLAEAQDRLKRKKAAVDDVDVDDGGDDVAVVSGGDNLL